MPRAGLAVLLVPVVSALIISGTGCGRPAAEPPKAKPPATIAELQQRIARVLQETKTPGIGIAIVRRDGPEWVAGIGLADVAARKPVTPDTLFRIG